MNYIKYDINCDDDFNFNIKILIIDKLDNKGDDFKHMLIVSKTYNDGDSLYLLEDDYLNDMDSYSIKFNNAYKEYKRKETIKDILR